MTLPQPDIPLLALPPSQPPGTHKEDKVKKAGPTFPTFALCHFRLPVHPGAVVLSCPRLRPSYVESLLSRKLQMYLGP